MSNVNNNGGNRNRGGGRKRNRGPAQPPSQPAKKKQKRSRRTRGGASGAIAASPAFSPAELHFAPVAIGAKMKKGKPIFFKDAQSQRIVHREKIAKLASGGTGAFSVLKSVSLNPGLAASFPWLSNEAAGYEMYRFNRLRYVWIPSIGSAVAGNVIMGPDYDAADAAPTSETQLSNYTNSDEERIWCPLAVELDPDLLNGQDRRKYVRTGALAANLDIKTYDSGNFFCAVVDDAAAQTGKLWVEYDITFYNPQIPPGGFYSTGSLLGLASLSAAAPFGTGASAAGAPAMSASNLVVTVTGVIPGQTYSFFSYIGGTGITAYAVTVTSGATASLGPVNSMVSAGQTFASCFESVDATAETIVLTLTCTATTVTSARALMTVNTPTNGF